MSISFTTIVAILIIIVMVALIAIYFTRFRHHHPDGFVPKAAWLRAGIYFCACYLTAMAAGVFDALLSNPIATTEQIADTTWWLWIGGLILLVTAAYWVIWARYTLRFDRRLDLAPQTVFGVLWGAASGLLFLSFYHVAQVIGKTWATWQVWLLAYVSPWSIKIKVVATHIPNITACLIFFAIYENYAIFVALQMWALLGASLAMRMPAPWSREVTPPATRSTGLFGLTRASGYVSTDPENDPYMRSAHLPHGQSL
jgi:hypothetical protein